jgi:hypothetical protein
MIRTERGLSATRESLMGLEEALLDLTRHRAEYHRATFELIAAPIREAILARRAEIDEYIGMTPGSPVPTAREAQPERKADAARLKALEELSAVDQELGGMGYEA